jgi:hypothetical protein
MSASVGNTINYALPRLHDIEAISRDIGMRDATDVLGEDT